jgi:hypothetical protein
VIRKGAAHAIIVSVKTQRRDKTALGALTVARRQTQYHTSPQSVPCRWAGSSKERCWRQSRWHRQRCPQLLHLRWHGQ